ncbi:RNA-dependent RNA polymerase [Rhizophagus irregularis mitovirus 1]|uniref:RNA-dependent RNA polymerase n=1 Tax=Rhizophagus irregularis mitovirus 1 TaxID=2320186 RepID=A0A385HDR8_9VIRU|nr:RNA-dependent RNA polymerase [Rhizophagus irregularis mitovirus 1]AXY40444.1 RNA-dependent RNA polymerase [Rhizophagus irregularis mitovirus 1]
MKNLFQNFVERKDRARIEKLGTGVGNYVSLIIRFGYAIAFLLGGRRHARFYLAVVHYGKWLREWNGSNKALVKYLKACSVTLMQFAGQGPIASSRDLGGVHGRSRSNLPRVIPVYHRVGIRRGDSRIIQFWLSLLGVYRIIECKGRVSYKSITQPGVERQFKVVYELGVMLQSLKTSDRTAQRVLDPIDLKSELKFQPRALLTSGANVPGGVGGFWALAWDALKIWKVRETPFGGAVNAFAYLTGQLDLLGLIELAATTATHDFRNPESVQDKRVGSKDSVMGVQKGFATLFGKMNKTGEDRSCTQWRMAPLSNFVTNLVLGRLHVIPEPAGKMRVVAMGTWWVQCMLYPLHRILYRKLGLIPNDGTWDQSKPLEGMAAKVKEILSSGGIPQVFSYDLSAATDRFPVWYQVEVLAFLTNRRFAETWRDLLIMPRYYTGSITVIPRGDALVYGSGQPMGLYSSWAMFSLAHHLLVQQAASRVGYKGWYPWYALLGDDIVILGEDVAGAYKDLCDQLQVKIGLAKSLISSNGSFEFAKRYYYKGNDCSPVSIREYWVSLSSLPAFAEMVMRIKRSVPDIRLSDAVRAYKYGYHSVAKLTQCIVKLGNSRLANLLAILMLPGGPFERSLLSLFSPTSTAVRPNDNVVDSPITERRVKSVSRTLGQSLCSVSARASSYLSSLTVYENELRVFDPIGFLRSVVISRMRVTLTNSSHVGLLERFGRYLLDGKLNSRGLVTLLGRIIPIWKFSVGDVAAYPDPFALDAAGGVLARPQTTKFLKLRVRLLGLPWKGRPKGGPKVTRKGSKARMGRKLTT